MGITGDTKWNEDIQWQYCDCDIVVLHLGDIKEHEVFSVFPVDNEKRLYKNHLGAIGVTLMLENLLYSKDCKTKLAIISEFGEELKGMRKEIVDLIRNSVERNIECRKEKDDERNGESRNQCKNRNSFSRSKCGKCAQCLKHEHIDCKPRCIIGDIGTKIKFENGNVKLLCEKKECKREAQLDDILLSGGEIAHFCSVHSPIESVNELAGLLYKKEF